MMVKANSRHKKVIELRHRERLLATVSSLLLPECEHTTLVAVLELLRRVNKENAKQGTHSIIVNVEKKI